MSWSSGLARVVEAEALDHLAPDDPLAVRSRRDLKRVHTAMGTRVTLCRALRSLPLPPPREAPLRVLELGAGDGSLMLRVANARLPGWERVELTLLDRVSLLTDATVALYAQAGWRARTRVVDVFDWSREPRPDERRWDLVVTNLFMHHFEGDALTVLLAAIARRADRFLACEPRRGWLALAGSHLIGAIGANAVTRQDAVLSVHAGFRGRELSSRWPGATPSDWALEERAAGAFSHLFTAVRRGSV